MLCGSHSQSIWPGCDFLVLLDQQVASRPALRTSPARDPWGRESWISPLRVSTICSPSSLVTTFKRVNLTMPSLLGLDVAFLDGAGRHAADVEGPHRELRARLADALGGDDAHGHALLDQRAGRQVHAVAAAADAQRRVAGHRAADLDLLQAQLFDPAGDSLVIISFSRTITSSVIGLTMFARLTRPRIESASRTSTFSPSIDDPLGDALRGAAVFHA